METATSGGTIELFRSNEDCVPTLVERMALATRPGRMDRPDGLFLNPNHHRLYAKLPLG